MDKTNEQTLADDATESVSLLVKLRLPWLVVGVVGAVFVSYLVSRFEVALSQDIHLAFFLPAIVYLSDAVGTQTEAIYVRNLGREVVNFHIYLVKEFGLGVMLGIILGTFMGLFAYLWLGDMAIGVTVGLATLINIMIAPLVALVMANILQREHTDPALGSGPFATIIQNIISLSVYFFVASLILFGS